jgi:iron complex transport system ATP-binding protein
VSEVGEPALAFEDVDFAYTREPVVAGVRLRVAAGEMVALLGPNGAGKSTLLGLASGVLRPDSGRVLLHGEDLHRLPRRRIARQIAVVPQEFSVQFSYTVRQLVEMGRAPHLGMLGAFGPADRAAVDEALAATSTADLADRVFNELSGGERQRAIVALALAQAPSILLLDEPTAHLDIKHQVEALALVRRLNAERGLTVVAALHDLNLAARYFSRLVLFRREIVADGPPGHVLEPALLSGVYGTPVRIGILRGEEYLSVLPPGHLEDGSQAPDSITTPRVHVLAGGGSGELLMRALADAGVPFSAGPLNAGDSDAALARRLAALTLEEPPYAAISPEGLAAVRERMRAVNAVVICPMPLGHGNMALLDAAREALAAKVRVILLEPALGRASRAGAGAQIDEDAALEAVAARDFSGRGVELYRALAAGGAVWVPSTGDVAGMVLAESAGQ